MTKPHVLVIPYPEQGHVIPLMELSLCLAKHGIKITFVNTQHNHERIMSSLPNRSDIESQISLVWIPDGLDSLEDMLRPGKSSESVLKFMPGKLEELIEGINGSQDEKINCVLADQSIGWALDIAEKKGIPRAAFCPAAAAQLVLALSIPRLIDNGIIDKDGTPLGKQIIQLSPAMPSVSTEKLVWVCVGNKATQTHIFELMKRNVESVKGTDWLLCNSTYDLEPAAFALAPEIIPIGPLLAGNQLGDSTGNFWPQDLTCLKWLDQQSPNSVIYVAFGSTTTSNPSQFQELALGLEMSNKPFLWVLQPDIAEGLKHAYPEGFEDREAHRGRLLGWAPQQKILQHPSVACFISHCGWNSTVESISNGIPMLCWPYFADQFLNKSYICNVWKVGLGFKEDDRGVTTRDEIRNKIEELLNDEDLKTRALDLKEKIRNGIGQGGTSSTKKNIDSFIKWIKTFPC